MKSVSIKSICYYVPEGRMTNNEIIEKMLNESRECLSPEDLDFLRYAFNRKLEFLEIKTRSYCIDKERENAINMSVKVSKEAVEKAGLKADDIDLVLFTGSCNPFHEPTFATILANQLGMSSGDFFDINDTCNGFLKAIELASLYINSGKYTSVLIVVCESTMELMEASGSNYRINNIEDADYKVNLLFGGSGAAAMVVSADNGNRVIKHYYEKRESNNWDIAFFLTPYIWLPPHRFKDKKSGTWSDGRNIASNVIRDMPDFVIQGAAELGFDLKSVDFVFSHQLGRNITYSLLDKIGVDREKVFPINTFIEFGNMGGANIPVGFGMAEERGLLKKGDSILLLSSACGLSYSLAYVIW